MNHSTKFSRASLVAFTLLAVSSLLTATRAEEGGQAQLGFQLYATSFDGSLYLVNPQTAKTTFLAEVPGGFFPGLAYDSADDLLFAWSTERALVGIDPHSRKVVWSYAFSVVGSGLAYQSSTHRLWTMIEQDSVWRLASIDINNPSVKIGPALELPSVPGSDTGIGLPQSLAFRNDTLYVGSVNGTDPGGLATVDTATGEMNFVIGLVPGATDLAFHPNGTLYVLGQNQSGPDGLLYTFDSRKMSFSWVGGSFESSAISPGAGIAFAPHLPGKVD